MRISFAPAAALSGALVVASFVACTSSSATDADAGPSERDAGHGGAGADAGDADSVTSNDAALPTSSDAGDAAFVDDSLIATGVGAGNLLVTGSYLYFIGQVDGVTTIERMPTTGGSPSVLYTPPAGYGLAALGSDGTNLYFLVAYLGGGSGLEVVTCGVDGSDPSTIFSPTGGYAYSGGSEIGDGNSFFVVGGTLYLNAEMNGDTAPVSIAPGGVLASVPIPVPSPSSTLVPLAALGWVDDAGLYFEATNATTQASWYGSSPLSGGSVSVLYTETNAQMYTETNAQMTGMGMVVAGGNVYIAERELEGTSPPLSTITVAPAAAAPDAGSSATTLASLSNWLLTSMVGDANGLYINDNEFSGAPAPGVYSVSTTTGATTLVQPSPVAQVNQLALDATHVYWLGSDSTVHAKAR
jgi:hypothetical protein